ncbi:hypothetical protein FH972_005618 [Carpinus fangiana]|uniref:Uncharacterized protein n=1 Tax=Carpinus fangiana TaxID=176857 RepID=A0A5N6QQS5_9ROSI|nr:hypothetical protein FH972_005618 [Carpinus fangiana]
MIWHQDNSSGESGLEEPVHIFAYYSSCGPTRSEELEKLLANIRDGSVLRAKNMVSKLNKLKLPLKWEHVAKIAGMGVAPGRLHVARAMVEAGVLGSEPLAEEAIQLISNTGGVAVLAHPWALKNPVAIIRRLKEAGLHGMEVYRSDGKLVAYSDLADGYGLLKLGGSDYHGRARPIWCRAIRDILESYAEEPSDSNLAKITRFGRTRILKGGSPMSSKDLIDRCLSLWLTNEVGQNAEFKAIRLKLSNISINQGGLQVPIESK